ncbi:unnamed protein product [Paramecium sonneborni]|uniref:Uncharacterized protein n=1 Tax=Paramecium sonneborni TaxID=65129 RepID=A0A8S1RQS0_9CILI|nr:unnamed protein product [Paramecium sonneborni]
MASPQYSFLCREITFFTVQYYLMQLIQQNIISFKYPPSFYYNSRNMYLNTHLLISLIQNLVQITQSKLQFMDHHMFKLKKQLLIFILQIKESNWQVQSFIKIASLELQKTYLQQLLMNRYQIRQLNEILNQIFYQIFTTLVNVKLQMCNLFSLMKSFDQIVKPPLIDKVNNRGFSYFLNYYKIIINLTLLLIKETIDLNKLLHIFDFTLESTIKIYAFMNQINEVDVWR